MDVTLLGETWELDRLCTMCTAGAVHRKEDLNFFFIELQDPK